MTAPGFLEGVGPVEQFYKDKDWSTCLIGPPERWPLRLRGYVDMILRIPTGAIIFWGPDQVQLYNLGYSDIMGPRHPKYLGGTYRECWPDTYPTIYPWMRRVLDDGEVIQVTNALIPVTRYGFTEETYFTFSFAPLRGDTDEIEGFIQHINETTKTVLAERRLATLRALAPRVDVQSDALTQARAAFKANAEDIPFAAVFVTSEETSELQPASVTGLEAPFPKLSAIAARVMETGVAESIDDISTILDEPRLGPWPEPATKAVVVPLRRAGSEEMRGVLAFGISSRLTFDDLYRSFLESAARELASNLAFEQENREKARLNLELQRRAEALTELDRAKTAFFSNVSHEFRTPLTLMLGPVEDALGDRDDALSPKQRDRLELVQRSGVRLFKLVNTVLDFSRIEAGRTQATFEPTNLAELTNDLASSFRSVIEGGGLALVIACEPLPAPVWVDREMWEKIVLNLISNAYKFTAAGRIDVSLALSSDGDIVLSVKDTGSGIPESELPKLFDRFHRVEGTKGRSFEGTGIGLALVQELVRLHRGEVGVISKPGEGTTFTVTLRPGKAHLPADRVRDTAPAAGAATAAATAAAGVAGGAFGRQTASSFVREAAGWSDDRGVSEAAAISAAEAAGGLQGHILLADDNLDMRDYVRRLLETRFTVEAVGDGIAALEAIERQRPDLVLTDVMMPRLDGFGLLKAIKESEKTKTLPVILLSARAGEESRVEGMEAGADDYLVKPFAARELLARVGARLEIARLHASLNHELERRVDARTAQLREANRELESFSYSVSHDLRAPLRHILGFSQLMEKSSKGTLDPKTQGYLKTISEAAERGGQLVDDLLAFSRMGRAEMRATMTDLNTLVADARKELGPEQEGRSIEWRLGDLPRVQGDPALLRLVMKNLLSNALKYTRTRSTAIIEIGATNAPATNAPATTTTTSSTSTNEIEIWIRDNGVGFEMQYVGKLFGVFQRLHTTTQFEGTGIGLALVRRIIARHGGRTWAEGKVDEGATIHFTLPTNPA